MGHQFEAIPKRRNYPSLTAHPSARFLASGRLAVHRDPDAEELKVRLTSRGGAPMLTGERKTAVQSWIHSK